ncbi:MULTISPECIES: hypothetical protein [Cyanophyceae]|uniref:hypothetical protein n=1 Tax=Cyanophyceae TaxID=3028117 RepID=UPI001689DF5E|nr:MULTISPECIES: hypothetical protein [Cyanophyceae]MBD1917165.1 hypothetical protein [Phormidium sp. FACHB-77]MBD2030696.1 hypothetical protein [Phormidium sp. FACHB-322]MBD2050196.1 hypothetical protein [Leptolyngbya sp. FACHB-60]
MGFTLTSNQLFSRGISTQIGRATGKAGNLLDRIVQAGKKIANVVTFGNLKGFLIGAALAQIPSLIFSLSNLWSMFTSAAIELYYFDWNIPDDRLDQQAKARWSAYGGILGGTAGNALGYFACGIVPATSLFAFDERLASYVLREVSTEAFEELTAQLSNVLRMSFRNLGRQTAGWLYKGARRWLKDPKNPIGGLLFGANADNVRKTWGEKNAPSWSFASAVDEKVEKIPSQFWQNFTEELIEEAIDACIEAGYVVSNSIEGYYAQQKLAQTLTNERQRVVEVQPNRQNDAEKFVLAGPESELRGQLTTILTTHQMVEDRDIGQVVGQPLDDYVRPRPFNGIRLQFQMKSLNSPPYQRVGNQRLVSVQVQISDVSRAKIDWEKLIFACGGRNGYLWGRFRAHAILDNGHPLTVYGGTAKEAEDRLMAFLTLTTAEITTISVTEEKKQAERLKNPKLYKETTRIYPAYVTIINRERTLAKDLGRRSRDGNYIDKRSRIDLWRQTKPANFDEVVRELLRRSDSTAPVSSP